jgi:hypothetical protein
MKTIQLTTLFIVVLLYGITTIFAYKIGSKHENLQQIETNEHLKKNIYTKTKDTTVKVNSNNNFASARVENKSKFNKNKRSSYEEEECDQISYIVESYYSSGVFDSKAVCNNNLKTYMKNIKKFQECYSEDPLGYKLEAQIYSYCMVDSDGNLCPLSRVINSNKNFKLEPTIENYKMNCVSEKCRLDSIQLNRSHQESFGEDITFIEINQHEEVEDFLSSNECLAMTVV